MYAYGQKKPLEAKEEKLQKLLEENKRYYPMAKNGKALTLRDSGFKMYW